jgi:chromosome transmission fidelity protein 1
LVFNLEHRREQSHVTTVAQVARMVSQKLRRGGLVVFVPSYEYLKSIGEQVAAAVLDTGASFLSDTGTQSLDQIFPRYKAEIEKKGQCVLLSVVGGRLSEGIDFKDDLCRCLILVGLPYPNIGDPVIRSRMAFYDEKHKGFPDFPNGRQFYDSRCMKAVNQCIGRSIRHSLDWSAVLLLDSRYGNDSIKTSLCSWVRDNLRETNFTTLESELTSFFHRASDEFRNE